MDEYSRSILKCSGAVVALGVLVSMMCVGVDALEGWLAGSLLSFLIMWVWMKRIQKAIEVEHITPKKAFTFFFFTYIMVYSLIGILLHGAIKKGLVFGGAFILGLFCVKVAMILDALIKRIRQA